MPYDFYCLKCATNYRNCGSYPAWQSVVAIVLVVGSASQPTNDAATMVYLTPRQDW